MWTAWSGQRLELEKLICSLTYPRTWRYTHTRRGVAQTGSAPRLGRGGRRFKSARPD